MRDTREEIDASRLKPILAYHNASDPVSIKSISIYIKVFKVLYVDGMG